MDAAEGLEEEELERGAGLPESLTAHETVLFPEHKRDRNNNWDEWWKRHDLFAKKAK